MDDFKAKISAFWRSKSGKVYFRVYGESKPFLIGHGVGDELVPFLAKNLGVLVQAEDRGDFFLVSWFLVIKVYLREDGQPVAWKDRALPYRWNNVSQVQRPRKRWLSENEYNGYYEPLR
ncbi:hypothetical protein SAMN04488136_1782, partial [Vibrio xiamenensis]